MSHRPQSIGVDIAACADRIEDLQLRDGAIPWIETGVWDPWNHGESAMALAVAGRETAVHAALDALAERQLALINEARAENSRAIFEDHAGEFRRQQEQIVDYSLYGPASAELLGGTQRGGELAVEIGPGEGGFLPELAKRYERVIALDNASAMLDKSREAAAANGLNNIDFVLADTASAGITERSVDCAVINMVLHHVPSPADIVADAARWLKPGGVLSITDLCPHNQSWAKEACGDLWLGIDPDELTDWAAAAGLEEGPAVFLAQKNGFRVQLRQFLKP